MAYIGEFENAMANGFRVIIFQHWNRGFAFFCDTSTNCDSTGQGYVESLVFMNFETRGMMLTENAV